jgi:3-phenylpropionate/trans-cinnamate dioxygenase ferredoxin reductase subunit
MTPPGAVLIVGSGQAGFQVAASLRDNGYDGRIILVGDEPGLPYQRPPLSKGYLTGETDAVRLRLRPASFYASHKIELIENDRVVAIDRREQRAQSAAGRDLAYEHLVLAVGARERTLQIAGAQLDGVLMLRTLADSETLRQRLAAVRDIVIVGAGFIGLELASVASKLGAHVHVVEIARYSMGRAVSADVSEFFTQAHARRGISILFGSALSRITGANGRVTGVETNNGLKLPADLVLVGIGVAPNTELAAQAGLAVDNGIVVDEYLRTADPAISAIGDAASYPSPFAGGRVRLESVQNAVDHARCVAARLVGRRSPYNSVPWFWSDQGDLRLQIVGLTNGHDTTVIRGEAESGKFSVFCFRGAKLLGIESVNRPGDHMAGRRLLAGMPTLTHEQAADQSFDLKAAVQVASRHRAIAT